MKFKNLTEEQLQYVANAYSDLSRGKSFEKRAMSLANEWHISEKTVRNWWSKGLNLKSKNTTESEQYLKAKERVFDKEKKRFIITCAQNATSAHKGLWKNILALSKEIDADVHVIANRYKNPTSVWTANNVSDEWWDKDLVPYLDANRHDIHKYVSILSDIKIQPTAVNPMTGMQGVSGVNSCIFGSPKVQMEMIPVLEGCKPKMMLTTGSVTQKNYTDSKAGKKGEFHHTFGFVVVEIKDDETFFARQVTADDKTGSFTDLCYRVEKGIVTTIDSIEAIVLGDLHYGHHDAKVLEKTFELMDDLNPKHVILHDVFDGNSISHHEMKDPFVQYGKELTGKNDLGKEVEEMLDGLKRFEKYKNVVVVRSNHDDFLDRWLKNEDWKKQPTFKNSRLYMKYSDTLLEQYGADPYKVKGIIPTIINERYPKFITLGRSESYKIKGWEVGQHGDLGSNGSRGSLLQFRQLNTKVIVGHYHSPGRKDGAMAVGTSTRLRVGYNKGASGWLNSHVIIHTDGRTQHINLTEDKNGKSQFTTYKLKN